MNLSLLFFVTIVLIQAKNAKELCSDKPELQTNGGLKHVNQKNRLHEETETSNCNDCASSAITENHRKMLKDLRTNLDAVKAGKNLDTSYSGRINRDYIMSETGVIYRYGMDGISRRIFDNLCCVVFYDTNMGRWNRFKIGRSKNERNWNTLEEIREKSRKDEEEE